MDVVKEKTKDVVAELTKKQNRDSELGIGLLTEQEMIDLDRSPSSDGTYEINETELSDLVSLKSDRNTLEKRGGIQGVCDALHSNLKDGLSEDIIDLEERRRRFGRNEFDEPPHASWFELFVDALKDVAVIILAIAAVISFAAGIIEAVIGKANGDEWMEGATILCAVLIVATVTATNDYAKDKQFRKLKQQNSDRKVRVIRSGKEHLISIFDICAGDIAVLHSGDKIPADGLFIPDVLAENTKSDHPPPPLPVGPPHHFQDNAWQS